jgi:hypothetical protein
MQWPGVLVHSCFFKGSQATSLSHTMSWGTVAPKWCLLLTVSPTSVYQLSFKNKES